MSNEEWMTSACILCELNCGIKVQTGGENDREIVRIRGDEDHPASKGYLCQKASGLNHYQNGKDRITSPLRRKPDGSFEVIDWDTATREIMERFAAIRDIHGGDKIFYYGGGGQEITCPELTRVQPAQCWVASIAPVLWRRRRPANFGSMVKCSDLWSRVTSTIAMSHFSLAKTPGIPTAYPEHVYSCATLRKIPVKP